MSFIYTEDSLKRLGYAGVPTTRISELVHGYQFDPHAVVSKAPGTRLDGAPAAGVASDDQLPRGVRTGKCCRAVQRWDTAGLSSEKLHNADFAGPRRAAGQRAGSTLTGGSIFSWDIADDREANGRGGLTARSPRLGEHRRRLATVQEEKTRFARAYICTDKKAGRTEIMTARRCGAAHLDLDLNHFDVYASHEGHRLLGQSQLHYDKESLETGLLPATEDRFKPGKALLTRPPCSVKATDGFLQAEPEQRQKQALGYLRRKIAAEWSRSNKSCFGLAEGYQPMHWRISPEKPLINVTYHTIVPSPYAVRSKAKSNEKPASSEHEGHPLNQDHSANTEQQRSAHGEGRTVSEETTV